MFVYNIQSKKNSSSAFQDFAEVKIQGKRGLFGQLTGSSPICHPRFWMLIQKYCLVKH